MVALAVAVRQMSQSVAPQLALAPAAAKPNACLAIAADDLITPQAPLMLTFLPIFRQDDSSTPVQ